MMGEWQVWALVVALLLAGRTALPHLLRPRRVIAEVVPAAVSSDGTLVALAHGVSGRRSVEGLIGLVQSTLPGADCLVLNYDSRAYGNTDPHIVADVFEQALHTHFSNGHFQRFILVGHSAGGALIRKAFVWGHGHEDDRGPFGARGKRKWVDHVERIVLLAGINRGWSIEEKPAKMGFAKYLGLGIALPLSRLAGVGGFTRSVYRGSPFIADTRVQWLRIARSEPVVQGSQRFPQVLQLLGDADDVVARKDCMDLVASQGTLFKTLSQTNHSDITQVFAADARPGAVERRSMIRAALVGDLASLQPDMPYAERASEDRSIRRVVFVMHGIRDYGHWTDKVRAEVERRFRASGEPAVATNPKYGYFPMLPFVLYKDRQRNVRKFVDEYTECLAQFPNADTVDFVGHSNGTYILASALVRYPTVRVRRVFFAGSVVPKHYEWLSLIRADRVSQVINVVATKDWVVALFPKLFEQIADWRNARPKEGWLDIGAAGFRGFLESGDPSGRVRDVKFAVGAHSTGVDVANERKLDAIAQYVVDGNLSGLEPAFRDGEEPDPRLDIASNVSYLVWIALGAALLGLAWSATAAWGLAGLVASFALIYALLNSL